jgi:hypothetical protein
VETVERLKLQIAQTEMSVLLEGILRLETGSTLAVEELDPEERMAHKTPQQVVQLREQALSLRQPMSFQGGGLLPPLPWTEFLRNLEVPMALERT